MKKIMSITFLALTSASTLNLSAADFPDKEQLSEFLGSTNFENKVVTDNQEQYDLLNANKNRIEAQQANNNATLYPTLQGRAGIYGFSGRAVNDFNDFGQSDIKYSEASISLLWSPNLIGYFNNRRFFSAEDQALLLQRKAVTSENLFRVLTSYNILIQLSAEYEKLSLELNVLNGEASKLKELKKVGLAKESALLSKLNEQNKVQSRMDKVSSLAATQVEMVNLFFPDFSFNIESDSLSNDLSSYQVTDKVIELNGQSLNTQAESVRAKNAQKKSNAGRFYDIVEAGPVAIGSTGVVRDGHSLEFNRPRDSRNSYFLGGQITINIAEIFGKGKKAQAKVDSYEQRAKYSSSLREDEKVKSTALEDIKIILKSLETTKNNLELFSDETVRRSLVLDYHSQVAELNKVYLEYLFATGNLSKSFLTKSLTK